MAGIKNKYDFYKGFLEALGAEGINETDYKNEEELRKKILDTMGVEYVFDDVNQTDLFRGKFLEGLANGSGGGGSSDFSTAEVTFISTVSSPAPEQEVIAIMEIMGEEGMISKFPLINGSLTVDVVLFKGSQIIYAPNDFNDITVTGDITEEEGEIIISGAGTISYGNK